MSNKRIISLLPAATEIICALASEALLVGVSHECDFPSSVQHLPKCSSSSISYDKSSQEIDQMVSEQLLAGLSLYQLNWELIKELRPDIIITQDQCKVCAIHLDDLTLQVQKELNYPVQIISINPRSVEDIFAAIETIAASIEQTVLAQELIEIYQDRLAIIAHKVKFVKNRPTVVFIEWLAPLMTSGHWTPSLINLAGGNSMLSTDQSDAGKIDFADLLNADPDFIIIAPCGFSIPRIKSEMHLLQNSEHWQSLKAVKENRIFIADGNAFFSRPGPRIIDSAEIVAEILQVNQFYFGLEGSAWEWLNA